MQRTNVPLRFALPSMTDDTSHPRGSRTVSERLVLVEDGLDRLRDQREREHKENQQLLLDIKNEVRTLNANTETVIHRQDALTVRVDNIEQWRSGLLSEIRGAMRVPKFLIALVPVASVIVAALAWVSR